MNNKEIQDWYDEVEKEYLKNENTNDMPEGDFNVLETEYTTLRTVLGLK